MFREPKSLGGLLFGLLSRLWGSLCLSVFFFFSPVYGLGFRAGGLHAAVQHVWCMLCELLQCLWKVGSKVMGGSLDWTQDQ